MHREGINRKELAERLGSSRSHVTQLLSGERNFTLRTLAEIAFTLGRRVHLATQSTTESPSRWYSRTRRGADRDPADRLPVRQDTGVWQWFRAGPSESASETPPRFLLPTTTVRHLTRRCAIRPRSGDTCVMSRRSDLNTQWLVWHNGEYVNVQVQDSALCRD
jgi:transcriptional regulator with XRE-family HTH domain